MVRNYEKLMRRKGWRGGREEEEERRRRLMKTKASRKRCGGVEKGAGIVGGWVRPKTV